MCPFTLPQDGLGYYTCSCVDGYEGDNCEIKINECVPNLCHNAGVCTVSRWVGLPALLSVTMPGKWLVESCISLLCGFHMQDMVNAFSCTCGYAYTGTICDDIIDFCDPNLCQNGGTCSVS